MIGADLKIRNQQLADVLRRAASLDSLVTSARESRGESVAFCVGPEHGQPCGDYVPADKAAEKRWAGVGGGKWRCVRCQRGCR